MPPHKPYNLKHRVFDLRGPAGNAYAVRGIAGSDIREIGGAEMEKEYEDELDRQPEDKKTYFNLIQITRKYIEYKWIGLPKEKDYA